MKTNQDIEQGDFRNQAQEAIAHHEWSRAVEILLAASKTQDIGAEGYEMLGQAAWWIGEQKISIDAREKAYAMRINEGDFASAGRLCLFIAELYHYENARAVSAYWFRLGKEILEKHKDSAAYGWYLRAEAISAFERDSDLASAMHFALQAEEIGREQGDRNLACLVRHDIGRFMMSSGKVHEGLEIMENAMSLVMSGQVEPMTTGKLFCNMIDACDQLVDFQRAGEWDAVARNWCERVGHSSGFPGICRVKRAGLMRMRGAWAEAEIEAMKAKQELTHLYAFAARAIYEVGEIRLRLGNLDGADQAFREAHALGFHSQPGLAMLYDEQGKTRAACEMLENVLSDISLPLKRVPIITALGMLAVKSNKKELAQSLSTELLQIAANFESEAINASALHLSGLLAYLHGDYEKALEAFRSTMKYWLNARLPYEIAHARLNIGNTLAKMGRTELARLEWETALSEFERLGAKPDVEKVRMAMARESDQPASDEKKALMFTDIVGSTALISIIGDSAWKHLVQWHDKTLRGLFELHLGKEADHAGDGFFVSFDTAQDAVRCAQEIQRTLLKHRTTQGFAPNVRIGIHSAQVSYSDSTIVGFEVHKAARIASLGDAGQIVASLEIAVVMDEAMILERKTSLVKGIEEAIEVVLLKWNE